MGMSGSADLNDRMFFRAASEKEFLDYQIKVLESRLEELKVRLTALGKNTADN